MNEGGKQEDIREKVYSLLASPYPPPPLPPLVCSCKLSRTPVTPGNPKCNTWLAKVLLVIVNHVKVYIYKCEVKFNMRVILFVLEFDVTEFRLR